MLVGRGCLPCHCSNELLKLLVGRDGEPSSAVRFDPIRVGDALRGENRIASLTPPLFGSHLEPEVAFENVEGLVFVYMNAQWRGVASPRGVFEHRDAIPAIAVRHAHADKCVEKPEIFGLVRHARSLR